MRRVLAFSAAGTLAWVLVFVVDVILRQGVGVLSLDVLGALAQVAGRQVLALAAGLALILQIERRARFGRWLALAIVGVLAVIPCWDQALFLTSGDRIAAHPRVAALRVGIAGLLWVALLGSFAWVRAALLPRWRPAWLRAAWLVLGGIAVAVGLRVVARELAAYAYFAVFATFVIAGMIAGLVAPLAARRRVLPVALAACALLACASAWQAARGGDSLALPTASLAELAQTAVGPSGARPTAKLDFSNSARFACRARGQTRHPKSLTLPASKRRNIVLISVDTLRDDMVHRVERGRPVMPKLSRFAAQSVEFSEAFSPYPATIYALGAALTGYSPSELLLAPGIPESIFRRAEGRFAAIHQFLPSHAWFRAAGISKLIVQGTRNSRASSAREQTDRAITYLTDVRARKQSTFAWVHYFEPHNPYHRHEEFDFGDDGRSRYLSEVALVDNELGRLLAFLEAGGWYEDTLVIVFADHGEALGEGDYWGHHVHLRRPIIDVPLVLRYPGSAPKRVTEVVELADIAPTVLEFAGLPVPATLAAKSLFQTLEDPEPRVSVSEAFPIRGGQLMSLATRVIDSVALLKERAAEVYEQGAKSYDPKVAVVAGPHRLIVNRNTGARELYDRTTDEVQSLHMQKPEVVAELEEALTDWHARQSELIYCRIVTQAR